MSIFRKLNKLSVLFFVLTSTCAMAQDTLVWDSEFETPFGIQNGSGIWMNQTPPPDPISTWRDIEDPTGPNVNFKTGDHVNFGGFTATGSAGTITLGEAITSGNVTINQTTGTWLFEGNPTNGGALNGGVLTLGSTNGVNFHNAATFTSTTVNTGVVTVGNGAGLGSLAGSVAVNSPGQLRLNRNGTYTANNSISGSGALVITGGNSGTGTVVLTNNNSSFTGSATVQNSARLELGSGLASGGLGSSTFNLSGTGSRLVVNRNNALTIGGAISGSGSFVQAGSGVTTLTGTNSYTGTTNVDAGTLLINGNNSGATGNLTVASGATLGGSGTVGGATTINGTIGPGNSPGVLNFANSLTLNGTTVMEIDGNAGEGVVSGHDHIQVGTNLAYGGALTLDFGTTFIVGNFSWDLFDFATTTSNWSSITLAGSYSGSLINLGSGNWGLNNGLNSWSFTGSNGVLSITAVPEPSSLLLMGTVGLAALGIRRRRA